MNRKYNLFISVLMMSVFLILPSVAVSAEKSVIVGFHEKPGPSEKALIHGAKGVIKRTYHLIPAVSASLPEQAVADLKKNKKIAYVEEDGIFTAVEPLLGDEYADSWGVKHIGSDIAHASGNKGAGITIGVIDSGIDYTHEDLDDNFIDGINFVQKADGSVDPFDFFDYTSRSHGTHIAGIIAAEENGIGVIGVAPEAELYAVRVLDGGGGGLLSWLISGIEWAVDHEIDIVNLSLQGKHFQSLQDACDYAYNAGVLLVAAGGNTSGGNVMYPAAYDSVIAVTGTDLFDEKAWFSPVGPEVELAAPGMIELDFSTPIPVCVGILSTCSVTKEGCVGDGGGRGYRGLCGTSQAAPHVAGTAALFLTSDLQDVNGDGIVDHKDVRLVLRDTAIDLGEPGQDDVYGFGLVNAAAGSLPVDVSFTIARTAGPPAHDAVTQHLAGVSYEVIISNNGLSNVDIKVFEGEALQKDLSSRYHFNGKEPQEVWFSIDATGRHYDITFTPFGKPGVSADIGISSQ